MHDRRHDRNDAEARVPSAIDPPEPHDRRHDLHDAPDDHAGERKLDLSARSLAERRPAPEPPANG